MDLLGESFLGPLREAGVANGRDTMLVNQEGSYLLHPEEKKQWGFDLNRNEKFSNDFEDIAQVVESGEAGVLTVGGQMLAYAPIYPKPGDESYYWVQIQTVPEEVVLAEVGQFRFVALTILVVGLIAMVSVGALLARRMITAPLTQIAEVLDFVAQGDYSSRVAIDSNDELGRVGTSSIRPSRRSSGPSTTSSTRRSAKSNRPTSSIEASRASLPACRPSRKAT